MYFPSITYRFILYDSARLFDIRFGHIRCSFMISLQRRKIFGLNPVSTFDLEDGHPPPCF